MSVPQWFTESISSLKDVGLLGNIELSDYDLSFQWERYEGDKNEQIVRDMLLRHRTRSYKLPVMAVMHKATEAARYFDGLQGITAGRLAITGVKEEWKGTELEAIRFQSTRGTCELEPGLVANKALQPEHVLGALNSISTDGQYYMVDGHALFLDEAERAAIENAGVMVEPAVPRPEAIRVIDDKAVDPGASGGFSFVDLERGAGSDEDIDYSHVVRTAFELQMTEGGPEQVAKYGGRPWLAEAGVAPKCPRCLAPTRLLFQSPLADLPIAIERDGVLQVFLCASEDAGDCFIHHSGVVVRVETAKLLPPSDKPQSGDLELMPVAGWGAIDDYPGSSYWHELGLDYDRASDDDLAADGGFKCGGWPDWKQDRDDACAECAKAATVVLQVPEHNGIYFGDSGALYLLVCDNDGCRKWAGGRIQYH